MVILRVHSKNTAPMHIGIMVVPNGPYIDPIARTLSNQHMSATTE
jgi:hypothetical protein